MASDSDKNSYGIKPNVKSIARNIDILEIVKVPKNWHFLYF